MKGVLVDTSSLISLSTNCLLWILDSLKDNVDFFVTKGVVDEAINNALRIDRFRYSGVRILKRLCEGVIDYAESDQSVSDELQNLANSSFFVNKSPFILVHRGEMTAISAAKRMSVNNLMVDERILATLIEDPYRIREILENRLHTRVKINDENLRSFHESVKDFKIISSADLVAAAYEKGLMEDYIKSFGGTKVRKDLMSGMLWGLKFSGCALSTKDINEYLRLLV